MTHCALLEYCKPGLFPHWRTLGTSARIVRSQENCRVAMEKAREEFGVPLILTPEDLASSNLDELSGMTYLSYFINEDSPGYKATLRWIQTRLPHLRISNFTSDWNDGLALCSLVHSLGASVEDFEHLSRDRSQWESNLQKGINGGKYLGVDPLLTAKELADPEVQPLGVMAYVARFQGISPKRRPRDKLTVTGTDLNNVHVNKPAHFKVHIKEGKVDLRQVRAEVRGPSLTPVECKLQLNQNGGSGTFVPVEIGMHALSVYCEGELVTGCPMHVRVHPDISRILFSGIDPCALGSLVEVLISSNGAGTGNIHVEAVAPSGKTMECTVKETDGVFTSTFMPNEIGSPFTIVSTADEPESPSSLNDAFFTRTLTPSGDRVSSSASSFFPSSLASSRVTSPTKTDPDGRVSRNAVEFLQSRIETTTTTRQETSVTHATRTNVESAGSRTVSTPPRGATPERPSSRHMSKAPPPPTPRKPAPAVPSPSVRNQSRALSEERNGNREEQFSSSRNSSTLERRKSPEMRQMTPPVVAQRQITKEEHRLDSRQETHHHIEHQRIRTSETSSEAKTVQGTRQAGPPPVAPRGGGDIAQVKISGEALKLVPVKQPATFRISAPDFDRDDFQVTIAAPTGREFPVHMDVPHPGEIDVEFITSEVGEHVIEVKLQGRPLPGSPFRSHAFDATKIKVGDVPNGVVGHPVEFEIDGAEAGSGNLEIMVNGDHVTSHVKPLGGHRFLASFVPRTATVHTVEMKFNGEKVPGSPWKCEVRDVPKRGPVSARGQTLQTFSCGKTASFEVHAPGCSKDDIKVNIKGPGKSRIQPVVVERPDCHVVEFTALEAGTYQIEVTAGGQKVPGSPFVSKAYDASCITLSDVPQSCVVGQTSQFQVDASRAGEGQLEISVNNGEVPNQVQVLNSGRCLVSFKPLRPVPHVVSIMFNGENVPGCPVVLQVSDVNQCSLDLSSLELVPVNHPSRFHVSGVSDEDQLRVTIVSPHDKKIPAKVSRSSRGGLNVEFVPDEVVDVGCAGEGNLAISVTSRNRDVPTVVHPMGGAKFAVSFVPNDGSDHIISISFNKEPVPGSPFKVKVHDGGKITAMDVSTLAAASVNKVVGFVVQNAAGKEQDLTVKVEGPDSSPLPCSLKDAGDRNLKVEFSPTKAGEHKIHVSHQGSPIAGSPFVCKVFDAHQIKVREVPRGFVGKPVTFLVETAHAGPGNLEVMVNNGRVPTTPQAQSTTQYAITFTPTDDRPHVIDVRFNGDHVPGSPFECQVVDLSKIKVVGEGIERVAINRPAAFVVDTHGQDVGQLSASVMGPNQVSLKTHVTGNHHSGYRVEYTPTEVGPNQVNVVLDGTPVPGSPFTCNVYDVSKVRVTGLNPGVVNKPVTFQGNPFKIDIRDIQAAVEAKAAPRMSTSAVVARGDGLKQGLVGSANSFEVDTNGVGGDIDIKVTGPSEAHQVRTNVLKLENNIFRAEYHTRDVGLYRIEVLHNGVPISGKPFVVEVVDPSRVKVVDIEDGIVGRSQTFRVDTTRAGHGALNVVIMAGGREVRNTIREAGPGVFKVSYTPKSDLPHKIDVYYNGHQAPGCPQIVEVRDPGHAIIAHGAGLKACELGKTSSFIIETGGYGDAKDFDILVSAPNGSPLPVKCYQQKDGSLLVEWNANTAGSHKVEVLYEGRPIPGSPFLCQIFDASRVILQKVRSTTFAVNEKISFALNRRDAGYSELDVTVTSPLGRHLPIEVKGTADGDGELIEFTPTVPGKYRIAITYGGIEVPGSPITFIAQDGGTPKVTGSGLTVAQSGVMASFKIDARGIWGRPDVRIDGPDSEPELTIEEEEEGIYVVSYLPIEIGVFDVHIRWNGKDIPGKRNCIRVSSFYISGELVILMDDEGRIPLTVGQEKKISVDVGDAGPGKLKVEVRGPEDVVETHLEQTSSHRYRITFTPEEEGDHFIYVYYNDVPHPNSPFLAHAEPLPPVLDHTRVVLRGHGLTGAKVGMEAEFVIDGSDAGPGCPEVSLNGVKTDIPVQLVPLGNNTYKALYTPSTPGAYLLNVMWSERQVKGCPLKVMVAASCDASRVLCSGDGLRGGTVGKEIKAFIDTRKGGPGELTAHCMGPHKMAHCELYDHRDGTFTLYLKPQEGGRHLLTIKYGGDHIPGSPYTLRIAGAPDASKVRVYGPGIEPGVLAVYQSRFICDTRGAGAGQLTVRIRGPKGAFRVEMQRESQKDRTILCKYDPTEPGDYRIEVKWSGEHVPGSPFMVMIFDTQEELTRFIQGQYSGGPGNAAAAASDYFGDGVTYGTGQMSWRGSTHEL
ncbi:hypothetical protein HPB52_012689 [Rhipicephalus sanguineus]|uniref:Calponin-homology (CH) domain-containing protein n=1 Tax=Rhipicephalus sanguineus TaxID=34632 RepID=A0A9D4PZU5_RHISA|nr:hypothetical protein HPB52_012689 [Rhipicephalus sanguineus]